jgi:hypothetical protein
MTSLILDLETLATTSEAVITEIGVIAFSIPDFKILDSLLVRPNILTQLASYRHADPDTIAWHQQQASLPTLIGDSALKDTIAAITRFIEFHEPRHVWIQGPDFDMPILANVARSILEDFFTQFGGELPWKFWTTRDARTAWDIAFPGVKHAKRPHHALPDCEATLADLAKALTELGRTHAA